MSKFSVVCVTDGLLLSRHRLFGRRCGRGDAGASSIDPNFTSGRRHRLESDRPERRLLPPPAGLGRSCPTSPPYSHGQGQSTYRVGITNPILKHGGEQMRKANERGACRQVPYIARERCWPRVSGLEHLYRAAIHILQAPDSRHHQRALPPVRHIYLNVPHSAPRDAVMVRANPSGTTKATSSWSIRWVE